MLYLIKKIYFTFQVRMVRERRRVARILFVLAVIFALCWLPYNLLTLFLDLDITLDKFGLDQVFMIIMPNTILYLFIRYMYTI